ncbi:MAG: CD1375 family protein [Peptococcaceae bacterium]
MRVVYVALIVNGRMTIDGVSKNLRAVVLADLEALGVDGQGMPLDAVA